MSETKSVEAQVSHSVHQRITDEVTSWPGVEAGTGRRGEWGFTVGKRQIGHLHSNHAAHFSFPKDVWAELKEEGATTTPSFRTRKGRPRAKSRPRTTCAT